MRELRRRATIAAGVLISVVAVYLVLLSFDAGAALDVLATANPLPLAGIGAAVVLQVFIRAARWSVLLPRASNDAVPASRLVAPLFVGYLGNTILPARLGDPMRAVILSRRDRIGLAGSLGTVLLERVIDVATLAPLALAAAFIVGAPGWAMQVLLLVAVLGVAVLVLLTTIGLGPLLWVAEQFGIAGRPRLHAALTSFTAALGGAARRRSILVAAAISLAAWLLDAMSFWLAGQAVGADLGYAAALLVGGFAVLGTAVPSAPGYVGTFELAAATMAAALGVPAASALALAIAVHGMVLLTITLGGLVSLAGMGIDLGEIRKTAGVGARG